MNLTEKDRALAAGFAGSNRPNAVSAAPSVSGEPACQVSLVEQLRSVPIGNRHVYDESPISSRSIPYGRLCREAAASIESIQQDAQALREALENVLSADSYRMAVIAASNDRMQLEHANERFWSAVDAARTALGRTV